MVIEVRLESHIPVAFYVRHNALGNIARRAVADERGHPGVKDEYFDRSRSEGLVRGFRMESATSNDRKTVDRLESQLDVELVDTHLQYLPLLCLQ